MESDYDRNADIDIRFLQVLVTHYTHHDRLLWGRVHIIFAIQAGVLSGAVTVQHNPLLALPLLGVGGILSVVWLFVFNRDLQARDENRSLIKTIAERISEDMFLDLSFKLGDPPVTLKPFPDVKDSDKDKWWRICTTRFDSRYFLWVPTYAVLWMRFALTLLVFLDLLLFMYICFAGGAVP